MAYKVEMVSVDRIKAAPFNPRDRVEERNLTDLKNSIQEFGILQPLITTGDYELADGHRRLACAKALGLTEVPVYSVRGHSVSRLWGGSNKGLRPVRARTWLSAVDGGLDIDDVAPGEHFRISELQRILQDDEFHILADSNRSPAIYSEARSIAKYLGESGDDFLRCVILWLNTHRMRYIVRRLREDNVPPEIVLEAINQNRPLERHWTLA